MSKTRRRNEEMQGEGNKEADRRYRRGVKQTVEDTTEEERAERARELSGEQAEDAHNAEAKGKARARQ